MFCYTNSIKSVVSIRVKCSRSRPISNKWSTDVVHLCISTTKIQQSTKCLLKKLFNINCMNPLQWQTLTIRYCCVCGEGWRWGGGQQWCNCLVSSQQLHGSTQLAHVRLVDIIKFSGTAVNNKTISILPPCGSTNHRPAIRVALGLGVAVRAARG